MSRETEGTSCEPRVNRMRVSGSGRVGKELSGFDEETVGGGTRVRVGDMGLRSEDDLESGEG